MPTRPDFPDLPGKGQSAILARIEAAGPEGMNGLYLEVDEEETEEVGGLRFVPGALRGIRAAHTLAGRMLGRDAAPEELGPLALRAITRGKRGDLLALHDRLTREPAREVLKAMLDYLSENAVPVDRFNAVSEWIVRTSPSASAVRAGLLMLGVVPGARHEALMMMLGRHSSFTGTAMTALRSSLPEDRAFAAMFELAPATSLWGRSEAIETLCSMLPGTGPGDDEDGGEVPPEPAEMRAFRRWLLRGAYLSDPAGGGYCFPDALHDGGALDEMSAPDAAQDDELMDALADLLSTACYLGPCGSILGYARTAVPVFARWLELVVTVPATRLRAAASARMLDYMRPDNPDPWYDDKRPFEPLCAAAKAWLNGPEIAALIVREAGGASPDDLAALLEIEGFSGGRAAREAALRAVAAAPDLHLWLALFRTKDRAQLEELAALARSVIDFSGERPGGEPALFQFDGVDLVLQCLRDHPGVGSDLLLAALQGASEATRGRAVYAIRRWPRDLWPEGAAALVPVDPDAEPGGD